MKFKPLIQTIPINISNDTESPPKLYSSTINPDINNVIAETPTHNIEINQSENSLISSFFCIETISITRIDAAKILLKQDVNTQTPPSISPFPKTLHLNINIFNQLKHMPFEDKMTCVSKNLYTIVL